MRVKRANMPMTVMTLMLLALTLMFAFTGFDFVRSLMPPELGMVPILAVLGMSVGAIMWEFAAANYAKNDAQMSVAMAMVYINVTADVLAMFGEVSRAGNLVGALPGFAQSIGTIIILLVLAANIYAGIMYRGHDPDQKAAREERQHAADMAEAERQASRAKQLATLEVRRRAAAVVAEQTDALAAELAGAMAQRTLDEVRSQHVNVIPNGGKPAGPLPPTDTAAR